MTPESLYRAFQTAAAIHALLDDESNAVLNKSRCTYLTLVAVGSGVWAATFDPCSDEPEWYEKPTIQHYPHSARSTDPAQAVMEAAVKLIEDLQLGIAV